MSYAAEMIPQLIPTMPTENATYMWELNDAVREIKTVIKNQYKCILANEDINVGYDVTIIECSPNKDMTINLPTAVGCAGKEYIIKNSKISTLTTNYHQVSKMPNTVVSDSSIGNAAWNNVTRLESNNWRANTPADIYFPYSQYMYESHYLFGSNFNFNIPSGATITGIEFIVDISSIGDSQQFLLENTRTYLTKAGNIVGQNKATFQPIGRERGVVIFGGNFDLWGTTWSVSDINNSGFGYKGAIKKYPYLAEHFFIYRTDICVYYTTITGSIYTMVIKPNGSETIDGQAQITFNSTARNAYHIISDGANWQLLGVF